MEELATWSFTGTQGEGATPTVGELRAEASGRAQALARRYYPVGIAAAFLAMVAGFFPSTSPLLLGSFFASPAAPAARAAPAGTSQAPAQTQQPLAVSSVPASFGFSVAPYQANPPEASTAGSYGEATSGPSPTAPSPGTGGSVPPSSQCPVPVPITSTPADSLISEVATLCDDLLGSQGSGTTGAPRDWVYLGRLQQQSGGELAAGATARPGTTVVLAGIEQGSSVLSSGQSASAISRTLSALERSGAVVGVVVVPDPSAQVARPESAAGDFGNFAAGVSSSLGTVSLIAVGAFEPGPTAPASEETLEAAEIMDGLGSLESRHVQGQAVGIWLGTPPNGCIGSSPLSAALVSAASASTNASRAWHAVQLLGATSSATSGCGGLSALDAQAGKFSLPGGLADLLTGPLQTSR